MGGLTALPRLSTPRLALEPVGPEHLDLLVELNSDPAVMRFVEPRPSTAAQTAIEWARRLGPQSDVGRGLGYWAGFENGDFVGWWSASSYADDPTQAGIGYRLHRTAWGRGLATEGARTMLEQAFACPGVTRVVASTMVVNTDSRAVLGKLGFTQVAASRLGTCRSRSCGFTVVSATDGPGRDGCCNCCTVPLRKVVDSHP